MVSLPLADHARATPLPDFGVLLNDDGDFAFTSLDPAESVRNLKAQIDSLAGTPVKTLTWSVGAGSEILYYPTNVANVWGWRPVPEKYDEAFGSWCRKAQAGMAADVDPIRVVGERAKGLGMYFVPSYRMNDDHFIFDPEEYPLTGEFWLDNRHLRIGESPQPADAHYGNLLDFSHEKVRQFRLDVIFEVIDRYGDLMDGMELDFNRFQMIFPKDKGPERSSLVTEMIRNVRTRLDEVAKEQGRPLYLFVRVPPSLADCHRMGYAIEDWLAPRLVDVVIPSQLMTLAHDMPVDEFVALCDPAGVSVYPSLYPRTSYTWPFLKDPGHTGYPKLPSRQIVPAYARGALANFRHQGARGVELYNFNLPADDRLYEIVRDSAAPQGLAHAPRANAIYAVTPGYYLDYTDTYQYKKQIPTTVKAGTPSTVRLPVGEHYNTPERKAALDYAGLRLGFKKGFPTGDWKMELQVNGMVLHRGTTAEKLVPTEGALVYFQTEIRDLAVLYHGDNTVRLVIEGISEISLEEVQLGMFFREHDMSL